MTTEDMSTTELPASFEESVTSAVQSTLACKADGNLRLRVDFDTSMGDETYTKLKSSMLFTQKFVSQIATGLLSVDDNEEVSKMAIKDSDAMTIRLYFPDAGSAALAQRDWKVASREALVPSCVRFASLSRDLPAATDVALLFVCPRASEVDSLKIVMKDVEEKNVLLIFINPGKKFTLFLLSLPLQLSSFDSQNCYNLLTELVNMGVTGYGAAGRMLREQLIDTLANSYYLRTLEWGAVTRAYPRGFSVWKSDETAPGGYTLLTTTKQLLNFEELEELYAAEYPERPNADFFGSLSRFIEGFGRI